MSCVSPCMVLQSIAAQLRILSDLLDGLCLGPDTLTFIFNGVPTTMITLPANKDVLTGNLLAARLGLPFPLPADTVVQASDPTLTSVALDVTTGVVVITRVGVAGGASILTALGGGLTATMDVTVVAAAADALAFDEASFIAS